LDAAARHPSRTELVAAQPPVDEPPEEQQAVAQSVLGARQWEG